MKQPHRMLLAGAFALVVAAAGADDFTGAAAGSFPGRWGATDKQPPAGVADSGDAGHGNVMCVPGRRGKGAGYTRMFLAKPARGGVLTVKFDFLVRGGKGVFEFGTMAPGISLKDFFNSTPLLLRWDGGNSTLGYHDGSAWRPLGKFSAGEWHTLALELAFPGEPGEGGFSVSLDGVKPEGGRIPMRGNADAVSSIWFVSRQVEGGGDGALLIDNVSVDQQALAAAEKPSPRIMSLSFFSKALNREKRYMAVLPEGVTADSSGKLPLLLLLHGRGRNERSLLDDPKGRAALFAFKGVVVLPSGDDGWYINSPIVAADRYGDYLGELLADAAAKLPVTAERTGRGISGWSMGGYGCAMFAEGHPGEFAVFAPMIGLLDFPRDGLPDGQSYKVPLTRFGEEREVWSRFNPINGAAALREMKILIITGNSAFDRTMNRNFEARLKELSIPCEYRELNGGHSFNVVTAATRLVVDFMNENLRVGERPM